MIQMTEEDMKEEERMALYVANPTSWLYSHSLFFL